MLDKKGKQLRGGSWEDILVASNAPVWGESAGVGWAQGCRP